MRLMAKFTVIFTLVLFAGVALIAWLSYRLVEDNARTFVLDQARLMMQAARSVRDYTTFQLKPLLTPEEQRNHTFLPQRVPAYAATEHFKYLREGLRDYTKRPRSTRRIRATALWIGRPTSSTPFETSRRCRS